MFSNDKIVKNNNLNDIIDKIRNKTQQLAGTQSMTCIEDVNSMMYKVFFDTYQTES